MEAIPHSGILIAVSWECEICANILAENKHVLLRHSTLRNGM